MWYITDVSRIFQQTIHQMLTFQPRWWVQKWEIRLCCALWNLLIERDCLNPNGISCATMSQTGFDAIWNFSIPEIVPEFSKKCKESEIFLTQKNVNSCTLSFLSRFPVMSKFVKDYFAHTIIIYHSNCSDSMLFGSGSSAHMLMKSILRNILRNVNISWEYHSLWWMADRNIHQCALWVAIWLWQLLNTSPVYFYFCTHAVPHSCTDLSPPMILPKSQGVLIRSLAFSKHHR